MDAAGRMVIPKALREHLGLRGSAAVEIELVGDHLEIRPRNVAARLTVKDGKRVFTTNADVAPLTDDEVRRLMDQARP